MKNSIQHFTPLDIPMTGFEDFPEIEQLAASAQLKQIFQEAEDRRSGQIGGAPSPNF